MLPARPGLANGNDSLARRMASAGLGIPILLLGVWLGSYWLTALAALVAMLGVLEYFRLIKHKAARLLLVPGLLWTAAFIASGHQGTAWAMPMVAAGGLLLLLLLYLPFVGRPGTAKGWLLTVTGPLYLGATLSYALLLRQLDTGAQWLLLALFPAFATDTAAYFVGRAIGRHSMAPRISPGKTWEGSIAGLLGGMGIALLLNGVFGLPLRIWEATLLGATIGMVAQLGDLLESALKRYAGAKEAGRLLPGHGGILDRLDSVVLNLVLVYYVATGVAT